MTHYYRPFCCLFITSLLVCGCGQGQEKNVSEQSAEIDSLMKTEHLSIQRFPLPISPAVELKLESNKNKSITSALQSLIEERRIIADSIAWMSLTDTIAPTVINLKMVSLTEKYSVLSEAIAATIANECGLTNDLQDVELYNGTGGVSMEFVDRFSPAVGRLQWRDDLAVVLGSEGIDPGNVNGHAWGTGALISDQYFITAGHCFDTTVRSQNWQLPVKGRKILPGIRLAKLMRVTFNYQRSGVTTLPRTDTISYEVDSLMEYREGGIDYAIVRLKRGRDGQLPGSRFGRLPVSRSPVVFDEMLCAIQHPNGQPKMVECGPAAQNNRPYIQYFDIDTYDKSSGSPVLSRSKNALVGIHVDGGCNRHQTKCNKASAVEYIVTVSPILRQVAR